MEKAWSTPPGSMNTAFYLPPSMLVSAIENVNAKMIIPGDPHLPLCPSGKYLRLKRIHFQLPYDVMWQWQHDQVNEHGWGVGGPPEPL